MPAERVVSGCQGSPFKPRGPSRDSLRLLGRPGHFGPPLLLNRIASYSLRVLKGQGLPSTICGQFLSLVASGLCCFEGSWAVAKWAVHYLGRSPVLHLFCQWSMSLSPQIQPGLARNFRFITPDLFPSRNLPMPLTFQGCISQWGRNQGDGLCLRVARGINRSGMMVQTKL